MRTQGSKEQARYRKMTQDDNGQASKREASKARAS
jgi:hypothetical protein